LVKAGLLQNNSKADSDKNTNTAAAKAGKAFGVGASYVATAKKAAKENPELAADAKSGKVLWNQRYMDLAWNPSQVLR
jgi:hypothetical protein